MELSGNTIPISRIKPNPENPRVIHDDKFKKLCKSLADFPQMMEKRPIVVDENWMILGGNMRFRALKENGLKAIPVEWVSIAEGWTDEQKKEFVIKDNAGFGEWDWDEIMNHWCDLPLSDWGLDLPEFMETETAKLSKLEVDESIYYEPKEMPNLKLGECVDREKFDAKVRAIEESGLTQEEKDVMKVFAYRFLKIDFESVANYYYFNASEEEKKVMERLRLVLTDNGLNGFIEDDILRAEELVMSGDEEGEDGE